MADSLQDLVPVFLFQFLKAMLYAWGETMVCYHRTPTLLFLLENITKSYHFFDQKWLCKSIFQLLLFECSCFMTIIIGIALKCFILSSSVPNRGSLCLIFFDQINTSCSPIYPHMVTYCDKWQMCGGEINLCQSVKDHGKFQNAFHFHAFVRVSQGKGPESIRSDPFDILIIRHVLVSQQHGIRQQSWLDWW